MSDSAILKTWRQVRENVDDLKVRERLMVLLMALALVYMVWDLVIFNPLAVAKANVDTQVSTVQQKIDAMKMEEQAILSAVDADPDRNIKNQIAQTKQELERLNTVLEELSLGLVPVDELTAILHDVLKKTKQLALVNLRTLPVEAVSLQPVQEFAIAATNENPDMISDEPEVTTGVYKHRVALKVQGNYRELLIYLRALENLDWRFYWDELHFEEEQYPDAIIRLHVYTLSTDEGLFGV